MFEMIKERSKLDPAIIIMFLIVLFFTILISSRYYYGLNINTGDLKEFSLEEKQRYKLSNLLGLDKVEDHRIDCKVYNPNKEKVIVLIHGHGESFGKIKQLAYIISEGLDYTTVYCRNPGSGDEKVDSDRWFSNRALWQGGSYQGILVNNYGSIIQELKDNGAKEINVIGFSLGSHAAMYLGALYPNVDRTISIAGLGYYHNMFYHSETQIIPEISTNFDMAEISCMNKKLTWIQGINDTVFELKYAKNIKFKCNNVDLITFEGGHELPNSDLIMGLIE